MDSSARNTKKPTRRYSIVGQALAATLCLSAYSACDQGPEDRDLLDDLDRGDGDECPVSDVPVAFHRATFNYSTWDYEFGYSDVIGLKGAPVDTDEGRWASLHDGNDAYVYFMNDGGTALHQFRYAEADDDGFGGGLGGLPGLGGFALPSFEYQRTISFFGYPSDADKSSFAMLHDGGATRLYFLNNGKNQLIQGALNPGSGRFEYGHNSIPKMTIADIPGDADWSGWGMLHSGDEYRLYSLGANDAKMHEYLWSDGAYRNLDHFEPFDITNHHPDTVRGDFGMLHGDGEYQLLMHMTVHEHPGLPDFPGCDGPLCFE
ncbi:MAG: hypothetical protein AAF799_27685 [Myxococcota bacterium]